MKQWNFDKLVVKKYPTRAQMGQGAAADAQQIIAEVIAEKGEVNMIFAAAPSQNEMLQSILSSTLIDWSKVNALHMDEYIGLPEGDSHTFGSYLYEHIFRHKAFKSVHYIRGSAPDPEEECLRYARLLEEYPVDVVLLGIGENGHIAFNDPWVAEFEDPKGVKVVRLDEMCRMQQVNDGCFATLADVPTHAITLTIPTLVSAKYMFCVVPAPTKAQAVKNTLYGPVAETCPASILRRHPNAVLYCDADSGLHIKEE